MKKIISAILALLLAASMTACGGKTLETVGETSAVATESETEAETSTESDLGVANTEETEAETSVEEETTEKAAEEPVQSEKDMIINDIISEASKNYDKDYHEYYYNGSTLLYTGGFGKNYGSFFIDTDTFTGNKISDTVSNEWYTFYINGNLYSVFCGYFKSIDFSGNTIAEFTDAEHQVSSIFFLENGNVLLEVYDGINKQTVWGIYSPKLELIREMPKLSVDAGHGTTEELEIYDIYRVYDNKAYVEYQGSNYRKIDLDTFEIMEPEENEVSGFMYSSNNIYILAGKYYYAYGQLYNLETGEIDYDIFDGYSNIFVTDKAFYFVVDYKLYRYISEAESELVYDGSAAESEFRAVSEDYFIVFDDVGIFLVDMKTGEEHKIEIN